MGLFVLVLGILLIATGVNGTISKAGDLLKGEFTGPGNFFTWMAAIIMVGMIGYVPKLRALSIAFLILVFVGILLTSGSGVFDRLSAALKDFNAGGAVKNAHNGSHDLAESGWDFLEDSSEILYDGGKVAAKVAKYFI